MSDNIETLLNQILHSRYGEDVRQSIHDAIERCYEDGKTGAIDLISRRHIENYVNAMSIGCDNTAGVLIDDIVQPYIDNGVSIFFPSGDYLTNGLIIKTPIRIFGEGVRSVLQASENCENIIYLTKNAFEVEINNLRLQGLEEKKINGINTEEYERPENSKTNRGVHIFDLYIHKCGGTGIIVEKSPGFGIIERCDIVNGENGIISNSPDLRLYDNEISDMTGIGISIYSTSHSLNNRPYLCGECGMEIKQHSSVLDDYYSQIENPIIIRGNNNRICMYAYGVGEGISDDKESTMISFESGCRNNRVSCYLINGLGSDIVRYVKNMFSFGVFAFNNRLSIDWDFSTLNIRENPNPIIPKTFHPSNKVFINGDEYIPETYYAKDAYSFNIDNGSAELNENYNVIESYTTDSFNEKTDIFCIISFRDTALQRFNDSDILMVTAEIETNDIPPTPNVFERRINLYVDDTYKETTGSDYSICNDGIINASFGINDLIATTTFRIGIGVHKLSDVSNAPSSTQYTIRKLKIRFQ